MLNPGRGHAGHCNARSPILVARTPPESYARAARLKVLRRFHSRTIRMNGLSRSLSSHKRREYVDAALDTHVAFAEAHTIGELRQGMVEVVPGDLALERLHLKRLHEVERCASRWVIESRRI